METMSLAQLILRLEDIARANVGSDGRALDVNMEVLLRVQDDEGNVMVGGLTSVDVDPGCTEVDALVMDGDEGASSDVCGACGGAGCSRCVQDFELGVEIHPVDVSPAAGDLVLTIGPDVGGEAGDGS